MNFIYKYIIIMSDDKEDIEKNIQQQEDIVTNS